MRETLGKIIMEILSFDKALQESAHHTRRHIFLGNGFSIACRPNIFTYGKLFDQADFSTLSAAAKGAFSALKTQDFEKVIEALRHASMLAPLYS